MIDFFLGSKQLSRFQGRIRAYQVPEFSDTDKICALCSDRTLSVDIENHMELPSRKVKPVIFFASSSRGARNVRVKALNEKVLVQS